MYVCKKKTRISFFFFLLFGRNFIFFKGNTKHMIEIFSTPLIFFIKVMYELRIFCFVIVVAVVFVGSYRTNLFILKASGDIEVISSLMILNLNEKIFVVVYLSWKFANFNVKICGIKFENFFFFVAVKMVFIKAEFNC